MINVLCDFMLIMAIALNNNNKKKKDKYWQLSKDPLTNGLNKN